MSPRAAGKDKRDATNKARIAALVAAQICCACQVGSTAGTNRKWCPDCRAKQTERNKRRALGLPATDTKAKGSGRWPGKRAWGNEPRPAEAAPSRCDYCGNGHATADCRRYSRAIRNPIAPGTGEAK